MSINPKSEIQWERVPVVGTEHQLDAPLKQCDVDSWVVDFDKMSPEAAAALKERMSTPVPVPEEKTVLLIDDGKLPTSLMDKLRDFNRDIVVVGGGYPQKHYFARHDIFDDEVSRMYPHVVEPLVIQREPIPGQVDKSILSSKIMKLIDRGVPRIAKEETPG